jgi:2-succinyl-5-enolpyruvyl-6-hydroxy-3-cyclohexene-1-carboxylate synthase
MGPLTTDASDSGAVGDSSTVSVTFRTPVEQACEGSREHIDVLCARYRPPAVEHEGGHSGDAVARRRRQLFDDPPDDLVVVEAGPDVGGVDTGPLGTGDDDVLVADVEPVREVGGEQFFLECRLATGSLGQPQGLMGEAGVRPHGDVESEVEAVAARDLTQMREDLLGAIRTPELAGIHLGDRRRRAGGCGRIELVGPVTDVEEFVRGCVPISGHLRHSGVESPLADVAPRADHVGPDFDEHGSTLRSGARGRIVVAVTPAERRPEDVQAAFCATLVDEWVALGVRHAVVAPGSRSTPMALALAANEELAVHVAHDERTASFMALGVGIVTGVPAVALCTSGTAATHFHAAVVEAGLADVPLIVVTADRPPELHDVGAPQTIEQTRLYGTAVRWYHDPGVPDSAVTHTWRSLAARAFVATVGARPGPVHLNLPFREPLVGVPGELPARRAATVMARTPSEPDADVVEAIRIVCSGRRGVIVAGRRCGSSDAVHLLARALGWPVLSDPRSGCGELETAVAAFDPVLRCDSFAAGHVPDVVVRLGDPPASKVLAQWVARSGAAVVQVGPTPAVIDPDHLVMHRVVTDPGALCRRLAQVVTPTDGSWLGDWVDAARRARSAIDVLLGDADRTLDEPTVAHTVARSVPAGGHLVVSSSMPIRDLEWFGPQRGDVTVHSNRGANGIDGVVATAIGVALATSAPTTVLLGDVALLHDASSLTALVSRGVDLRIVVVDNDGGGIFSFLPQRGIVDDARFEQLYGTPHGTDIVALGRAHGIDGHAVSTVGELAAAFAVPGPALVLIRTDRAANVVDHDVVNAAVSAAMLADPAGSGAHDR